MKEGRATSKHWDVQQAVKKAAIAGNSNMHEGVNVDKEYNANGDVLGEIKTKKMWLADNTNFTEEDIDPNHAKEQLDQL
eukprot:324833-Ditylum_brightwellii.AAC.1